MNPDWKALLGRAHAKLPQGVLLPILVTGILGAMIVPLPAWLLDVGLALNLAASAALLVAALTVKDALQVTSFPTLLLVTTLLRLALNVSSTRLALAEAHAGQVIQAFGEFVVGGDYVVGGVVFVILTLVQFLVVAKGAERVAEVSARFTLDAMPGKQMSIDADLRAGSIDPAQARVRRSALERESQMFGAMDGAMKFVKGDVIAGLVIVLVNLLGGLAVGVLQNGMELSEAASVYALIAIGDGLVSQLPSLCIAVAAGLVVTRVSSERGDGSLGGEIGRQFFGEAKPMFVVAGLCVALALVPGMPRLTFLMVALALGAGGLLLQRRAGRGAGEEGRLAPEVSPGAEACAPAVSPPETPVGVAPLTLDFAPDLSAWVLEEDARLVKRDLIQLRERLFQELGVRVPGIRVRTGAAYLPAGTYAVQIEDVPAAHGTLNPGFLSLAGKAEEFKFLGIPLEAGAPGWNGEPRWKVAVEHRSTLKLAQVPAQTAQEQLFEHLSLLIRRHASRLLGVQEVQALLDGLEPSAPALVKAALEKVPLPLLTEVLRRLVDEDVSIRNLRALLEALVSPATEGDALQLAERCRQALHRYFSHKFAPTGTLYAYLVDPELEGLLGEQAQLGALAPEQVQGILEGVRRMAPNGQAVVLAAPHVRRPLRKLCEGAFPWLHVLTYADLNPDQQIRPVGKLALPAS